DASGKDSTIKHVMSGVNPQAVAVRAFKQPSAEELNHDYLWRYQCALPGRGTIGPDDRHDGRHQREPHDEGVQEHHPTGAERLAFNAVFFIPECLPDLVDLTDEELREALHTTMLRILRV